MKQQLEAVEKQQVKLLELPMFLETACKDILSKLPLEAFAPGLLEEALTALGPREEDFFRLERLPHLIEEVKKKLQETQPRLDVERAREGVAEVLKSVFMEQRHLTMQVDQKGMVKVSFDCETLATRCLGAVAGSFQGFGSEKQFENDVILPALEATQTVPEACLDRRRQVFARMEKCAEALEKLVKTRTSLAESLDASGKALEPRSKVLQHWLQGEAVPSACEVISGDSPEDQSFNSPACNFITSVLKDIRLRQEEEAAKLAATAEFETAFCPSLPHPTYQAAAAALDGKIYVIGGQQTRRTVQILDVSNKTWSQGPELTCERRYAAAAVIGNSLYVAGGLDASGSSSLSSMECWSPQSAQAWSLGPDSGQRRFAHAAVELEGKLVLLGGHDGSQCLKSVQRFDPATERWEQLPPLREPRANLTAAVVGGKIFAVGGNYGSSVLSSVEVFDPADGGAWSPGPSLRRGRHCHAAAQVAGRLYVLGGNRSEAEIFEESAGSWVEGPTLKHPRTYAAAAVWDGTLYVLGGDTDSESQRSVEVLPSAEVRMRRALAALNGVPP